jgi:hypothetical protein
VPTATIDETIDETSTSISTTTELNVQLTVCEARYSVARLRCKVGGGAFRVVSCLDSESRTHDPIRCTLLLPTASQSRFRFIAIIVPAYTYFVVLRVRLCAFLYAVWDRKSSTLGM